MITSPIRLCVGVLGTFFHSVKHHKKIFVRGRTVYFCTKPQTSAQLTTKFLDKVTTQFIIYIPKQRKPKNSNSIVPISFSFASYWIISSTWCPLLMLHSYRVISLKIINMDLMVYSVEPKVAFCPNFLNTL